MPTQIRISGHRPRMHEDDTDSTAPPSKFQFFLDRNTAAQPQTGGRSIKGVITNRSLIRWCRQCSEMRELAAAGIHSRRSRKAALSDGGPEIHSRGSKHLRACSAVAAAQVNPSWGAKRARTALGDGGKPAPSSLSLPIPCPINNSGTRDWANLGDGPAGLIADLILANDVADYVRFRAVCRPWRRCSVDPCSQGGGGGLECRFLPRQWIMLDKAHGSTRCLRFLNISTGECIRMDLSELAEHTLLSFTPEGLLLLFHEPSFLIRLLNPLTRRLTDLPPVTALLRWQQRERMCRGQKLGECLEVDSVGLVADVSTVVVNFFKPRVLAIAKPGDESWTIVSEDIFIHSTLPFAGRFYCATSKGVMELKISSDQKPPSLVRVVKLLFCFTRMSDTLHLIDNGGELLLLHRTIRWDNYAGCLNRKYEVCRVDLDAGILIPVKGFNGRALFMGMFRAISVSTQAFPFVAADTLYFGFGYHENISTITMDGYNIADGGSDLRRPCTIVNCLSYCINSARG